MGDATTVDVLARLEALTARLDSLEAENARLMAENAGLRSDGAGRAAIPPTSRSLSAAAPESKVGRRGMVRKIVGATAAAALLTLAKKAARVEAAARGTILSGSSSTANYGVLATYGSDDPASNIANVASSVHGIIGATDSPGFAPPTSSAVLGQSSSFAGVLGLSNLSAGVWGQAVNNYGVYGTSTNAHAVFGQAAGFQAAVFGEGSTNGIGIWGNSQSRAAIYGTSTGQTGIFGVTKASSPGSTPAPPALSGVAGQGFGRIGVQGISDTAIGVQGTSTDGIGVYGQSTGNYGMQGVTTKTGYAGLVGVGNQPGSAGFYALGVNGATAGTFQGNVVINGSLTVTGSYPKSAAVKKRDGTLARMYCVEAPESWFEDFGTATLTNGQASVPLDPEFDEVVRGDDYRVFLTPIGVDCSLYVSRKGPHRFEVRSVGGVPADGTFDYRVVARRLDNVGTRMEKVDVPTMAPIDIASLTQPPTPPTTPRSGGR